MVVRIEGVGKGGNPEATRDFCPPVTFGRPILASNVGHQFTGHPTLSATRVDAFLVLPPQQTCLLFNQLLLSLL
jgi:hypothetical protein